MARAIVCLPSYRDTILPSVAALLEKVKVKIFQSIDDGFDYLWADGKEVGLFILELDEFHVEELRSCAREWSDLLFIALHDSAESMPDSADNLAFICHDVTTAGIIKVIAELVIPQLPQLTGS